MKWRRILAGILVWALAMTILPASAFAEEDNDGVPLPSFSKEMLDEKGALKRALEKAPDYEALDRLNLIAEAVATEKVLVIKAGSSADTINEALKSAVQYGKQGRTLVVNFEKGTYKLNKCLNVYSNTTIQATGATFIRTDTTKNLLRNVDSNGKTKEKGGYDVSQNIVIRGGTWDGGDVKNAKSTNNTMNFGHVKNLYIQQATFKNNYGAHLIELSAVYNAQITDCKFSGHIATGSLAKEAIQLDVAGYDASGPWTSTYKADWTVCDKILIQNCTVTGYPRAVGNHHYKSGSYNKNITITGNTFKDLAAKNKEGKVLSHYAIFLFGFDNVTVTNNKISGCETAVALHHASGINIKNNSISDTNGNGISIYNSSRVKEISGNTVSGTGKYGISINSASTANSIKNNNISATQREGICISQKGTEISAIEGNKIAKTGQGGSYNGLLVNTSAKVGNIRNNTIQSVSKNGILVYDAVAKSITDNLFSACKAAAISYRGSKYAMSATMSVGTVKSASTAITGSTSPKAGVWVMIGKKKYSATADSKGRYSIKIPKQKKGTSLTVYAKIANGNAVFASKKVS